MVQWLISLNVGLSVAFASFGSLLLLSPVFLGTLAAFNDLIHLTDDILPVGQEISVFVDWGVPRRHRRPVDVGDIWERDEAFAIGSIYFFHGPVPFKICIASFGTFNDLGWLVGVRVHVRPGIAHKCGRSWFIGICKSGRFGVIPREV